MLFAFGINRQKENCLSLAEILTSKYQSIFDDRMKIKRTSDVVNMRERIRAELQHCPVMKDQ